MEGEDGVIDFGTIGPIENLPLHLRYKLRCNMRQFERLKQQIERYNRTMFTRMLQQARQYLNNTAGTHEWVSFNIYSQDDESRAQHIDRLSLYHHTIRNDYRETIIMRRIVSNARRPNTGPFRYKATVVTEDNLHLYPGEEICNIVVEIRFEI